MPGFDGFSVIQGLMEVEPPLFVFVTAYSDHAIRAFEAQAVDYLMKPVEEDRLADTMDRIRQRLSEKRGAEEVGRLKEVLAEVAPDSVNVEGVEDAHASSRYEKIGRASCRERVCSVRVDLGGRRNIKKKKITVKQNRQKTHKLQHCTNK